MDLHIELSLYQFLIVASVDNKLRRIKSAATIITLIVIANIPTASSRFVFSPNLYLDCSEEKLTINKEIEAKSNPQNSFKIENVQILDI